MVSSPALTSEFATLRTKRAYVKAAIDSLLLNQAQVNAKPVAVSDTTALEEKLKHGDLLGMMQKAIDLAKREDYRAAEVILNQAIEKYPDSYYPQYNMCRLILKANPDNREGANRFYQAGRALGGPKVKDFEGLNQ